MMIKTARVSGNYGEIAELPIVGQCEIRKAAV
jgi:hypothetical protein